MNFIEEIQKNNMRLEEAVRIALKKSYRCLCILLIDEDDPERSLQQEKEARCNWGW